MSFSFNLDFVALQDYFSHFEPSREDKTRDPGGEKKKLCTRKKNFACLM